MPQEHKPCNGCIHRWWVMAHPYGMSSSGWGCGYTGGRALERCKAYDDSGPEGSAVQPITDLYRR